MLTDMLTTPDMLTPISLPAASTSPGRLGRKQVRSHVQHGQGGRGVVLEGGLYIVDAAHLIPYAESQDDDPRNGIALCKNHYWAMEQNLIAPGTDRAWHVLKPLDDRLEGQRELIPLDGRTLLLPRERRYHPKEEGLRWRERGLGGGVSG
jgi:hypothetical protein